MKKLFLALVLATLSFGVFAQNGFVPVYVVADSSTKFNRILEIGTPVYCVSLNKFYVTKVRIGTTNTYTVGWLLGSTSRYTQPDFASSTTFSTDNATVNDTLFVGGTTNYIFENTTNGMKVPNSWTVTDTAFIGSANYIWQNTVNGLAIPNSLTATDTVFAARVYGVSQLITGTQTITPTNTNKATFNNSLGVTDTLFVGGTANYVFQNTVNGLKVPNSMTVTDSVLAAQATTSGNTTAQYLAITATDTVTAAPVGSIIYRQADSTLWIKIKATGTKAARWNKVTVGK